MDIKSKVLLQFFNKIKLKWDQNVSKAIFFSVYTVVKFNKLGFSAPLSVLSGFKAGCIAFQCRL